MPVPPLDADDHVAGPPDAPLELIMYRDFQCPYCAASQTIVAPRAERLDGRLRFAFRHLPLHEVHPDAQSAAEASEARARARSGRCTTRCTPAAARSPPRTWPKWRGGRDSMSSASAPS